MARAPYGRITKRARLCCLVIIGIFNCLQFSSMKWNVFECPMFNNGHGYSESVPDLGKRKAAATAVYYIAF